MSHHQQPRNAYRQGPEMRGSVHLTAEENETLVSACRDRRWQVLAMGVAEVYQSGPPPRHDRWQRRCCGVACFIKDNIARAFYIRLFDFDRMDFAWEQELFIEFKYRIQLPYFHTFEADDCQAGLNFAFEDEATNFGNAVEDKLRNRRQKREEKERTRQQEAARNNRAFPKHDPQIPTCPSTNGILSQHHKKKSKADKKKPGKKEKERRYTKADISNPTDFKHIQHVGWDPDKGFDLENYVDSKELSTLFEMAMVTESDLKEPGTRQFIYDFIAKNGGADMIKGTAGKAGAAAPPAPPAVPSREHTTGPPTRPPPHPHPPNGAVPRAMPPPPPVRTGQPRAPPTPLSNGRARSAASPQAAPPPPPPPPPPLGMGGAPPPPPPAAPVMPAANGIGAGLGGGGGQDARGALLEQIRKGKPLNHVDPETESTHSTHSNPDSREALLDQIRGGVQLKSVPDSARISPSENKLEGLAGALARALQERAKACMPDDSDSSDDSESEEDEWDD